jgi:hypothetical protein
MRAHPLHGQTHRHPRPLHQSEREREREREMTGALAPFSYLVVQYSKVSEAALGTVV